MDSVHELQHISRRLQPELLSRISGQVARLRLSLGVAPDILVRKKYRRGPTLALITGLAVLTGILDLLTGPDIALPVFYLAPVTVAAWQISGLAGALTAVGCAATGLLADVISNDSHGHFAVPLWNASTRLLRFIVIAALVATVRRLTNGLEEAVQQRTEELHHEINERRKLEQELSVQIRRHDRAVAHELHDGLAQVLTGLSCKAKLLEQELKESASPYAHRAQEIAHWLGDAVGQTRDIARGLDPVEVEANELRSALQKLATDTSELFRVRCVLDGGEKPVVVEGFTGFHLYRITQQAIDNALRHGKAKQIHIEVERTTGELRLSIADNGKGFIPTAGSHRGLGLRSMKFRAELLGGELNISSQEGTGTRIECRVPEAHVYPIEFQE